jgi:hypothetical protein
MAKLIGSPTPLPAPGSHAKNVEEYVGLINTGDAAISIARTRCSGGWKEPAKCAKFDEYAIVLSGMLRVEHAGGAIEVEAGQAVHVSRDEWVRYSTPGEEGPSTSRCVRRRSRARPFVGKIERVTAVRPRIELRVRSSSGSAVARAAVPNAKS